MGVLGRFVEILIKQRSRLVPKLITDKRGFKRKVWVKPEEAAAAPKPDKHVDAPKQQTKAALEDDVSSRVKKVLGSIVEDVASGKGSHQYAKFRDLRNKLQKISEAAKVVGNDKLATHASEMMDKVKQIHETKGWSKKHALIQGMLQEKPTAPIKTPTKPKEKPTEKPKEEVNPTKEKKEKKQPVPKGALPPDEDGFQPEKEWTPPTPRATEKDADNILNEIEKKARKPAVKLPTEPENLKKRLDDMRVILKNNRKKLDWIASEALAGGEHMSVYYRAWQTRSGYTDLLSHYIDDYETYAFHTTSDDAKVHLKKMTMASMTAQDFGMDKTVYKERVQNFLDNEYPASLSFDFAFLSKQATYKSFEDDPESLRSGINGDYMPLNFGKGGVIKSRIRLSGTEQKLRGGHVPSCTLNHELTHMIIAHVIKQDRTHGIVDQCAHEPLNKKGIEKTQKLPDESFSDAIMLSSGKAFSFEKAMWQCVKDIKGEGKDKKFETHAKSWKLMEISGAGNIKDQYSFYTFFHKKNENAGLTEHVSTFVTAYKSIKNWEAGHFDAVDSSALLVKNKSLSKSKLITNSQKDVATRAMVEFKKGIKPLFDHLPNSAEMVDNVVEWLDHFTSDGFLASLIK